MNFIHQKNRISVSNEQGETIAEVTFPEISENTVEVDHTFVDESLRGQGVASMLMSELVNDLKMTNRKAKPTCSFAISWFDKHPECNDVVLPDTI